VLAEEGDDFGVAIFLCTPQRGPSFIIFCVHIGPVTDKQFDHCFVAFLGCTMQWRAAVLILRIDIGAVGYEYCYNLLMG